MFLNMPGAIDALEAIFFTLFPLLRLKFILNKSESEFAAARTTFDLPVPLNVIVLCASCLPVVSL